MKIHDSVLGLLFVLIGGAFLFVVSGYPKMPGQDVGPSMFPGITAALLAMFGLILFVRGLINASQGQALIALGDWTASPRHIAAGFSVIAGTALYTAFANAVGFLLIMPPLLFWWHVTLGVRWRTALLSALLTTGVVWALFYKVLGVPLPWGFLKNHAF
jgi:putative tricarboxylic transport membrane protein